ncbi:hypothetical protein NS228_18165, partial [Methylobacterium indicum]
KGVERPRVASTFFNVVYRDVGHRRRPTHRQGVAHAALSIVGRNGSGARPAVRTRGCRLRRDGTSFSTDVVTEPIRDEQGSLVGAFGRLARARPTSYQAGRAAAPSGWAAGGTESR